MTVAVDRHPDVEYRRVGTSSLHLDVYRPRDADGALPAVVYLHGGGWARGARTDHAEHRLVPVAASGLVVVSASYRFSSTALWPAQLEDVLAAIAHVVEHAATYGADPARVGLWGASAGGHLALMAALSTDRPPITAAVAWFAPTDLVALQTDPVDPGAVTPPFAAGRAAPTTPPEAALVGATAAGRRLDALRYASPVAHVRPGAPPLLLVTGSRDAMMPSSQARRLLPPLEAAGVEHQLLVVDGATHEDPAFHTPAVLGAVSGWLSARRDH
ncbi:alpha/beta hydrolase [Actinomycetospora termitidis]|uniref:Alpha/beta hydrolase n=1 Tax=Actinomycetospora termitidis TaxID=3053470 RepID=A0ABT7M9P5_9PSEU|nr:alpha/beta hydrolase [Actinomycetospora sp. Odt1-22]MDL5156133.1 alpha/beta hydrolase [Actinomycetospora sp. Odt1-22]